MATLREIAGGFGGAPVHAFTLTVPYARERVLDTMSSDPRVSVIIIFLNEQRFIQEAIESVFAQTYDAWELLLVDDGSIDGSSGIALQYAERYPDKVRYLEHESHQNRGMSASRNLGHRHGRGKYIAYLDADDIWLPHKLAQQIAILESYPEAALVCGRSQWWYSWTGNPEDAERDFLQHFDVQLNTLAEPPKMLILFLLDWGASLCDVMIRREGVEDVGGYEEAFQGMYEDQVFHAKVCLKGPVFVSSECWYRYRQHPESCCFIEVSTGRHHSKRLAFFNWLEKYLFEKGFAGTEVWNVLQKQLWPYRHPMLFHISGRTQHLLRQMKDLIWQI